MNPSVAFPSWVFEPVLQEASELEHKLDELRVKDRAERRADDQALWEEQLDLLLEYRTTNMTPEKLSRIWLYNRKHAEAIRDWRRCPIVPSVRRTLIA